MNSELRNNVFELFAGLLIPSAKTFRSIKLQPELDRFENDAEHGFLLAVLACALAERMELKLDLGKVSQYALVHDLVEAVADMTPESIDGLLKRGARRHCDSSAVRPLLRANRTRVKTAHTVVFFIFVVSNCGGLLTPRQFVAST